MANSVDQAASNVVGMVTYSETNLMDAYGLREGADPQMIIQLGDRLGVTKMGTDANGKAIKVAPDLRSLQLIAEQRYQHSSQVFNMFSSLLDKIDQMKQRLIQKFGQS